MLYSLIIKYMKSKIIGILLKPLIYARFFSLLLTIVLLTLLPESTNGTKISIKEFIVVCVGLWCFITVITSFFVYSTFFALYITNFIISKFNIEYTSSYCGNSCDTGSSIGQFMNIEMKGKTHKIYTTLMGSNLYSTEVQINRDVIRLWFFKN